ncbi:MAG: DUF58 domain-containing protein [Oscillospiraceae bacterium]|nr:DUF58 domain-containing protein [Oscillospiraceae bacterium]
MKIKPTWGLLAYVVVLVLSVYPAVFVNGVAGYLPCFALLFCGAASFVHLLLIRKKISAQARLDELELRRGDESPFSVELENNGHLPVPLLNVRFFIGDVHGLDEHEFPLSVTLSAREKRSFQLQASFPHLGIYRAGVRRIEARDLLGLFSARSGAGDRQEIFVNPKLVSPQDLVLDDKRSQESAYARVASAMSGMDYVGVRDYALGDPIKMIQWKLSAHADGLMTKLMESYTATGMSIVLDFDPAGLGREEALGMLDGVVETGMSLGRWASQNGMEYNVVMPMEDGQFAQTIPTDFENLQQYMQYIHLTEDKNSDALVRVLRQRCASAHSHNNVALCTARLNREVVAALQYVKQSRKNPALYLLQPEQVDENRRKETQTLLMQLQGSDIPYLVGKNAGEVLG